MEKLFVEIVRTDLAHPKYIIQHRFHTAHAYIACYSAFLHIMGITSYGIVFAGTKFHAFYGFLWVTVFANIRNKLIGFWKFYSVTRCHSFIDNIMVENSQKLSRILIFCVCEVCYLFTFGLFRIGVYKESTSTNSPGWVKCQPNMKVPGNYILYFIFIINLKQNI